MVVLHILLALWGITTGSSTIVVIGVAARRRSGFLRVRGTRRRRAPSLLASIIADLWRLIFHFRVVIGVVTRRRSGFLRGNGTRRRLLSSLASISLNYDRLLFLTGGYLRLCKYEH